MAAANPAPTNAEPPAAVLEAEILLDVIDERSGAMTHSTKTHEELANGPLRRPRNWAWALAGGFVVAILTIGIAALAFRGDTPDVADEPTVATIEAPRSSITEAPASPVTEPTTPPGTSTTEVVTTTTMAPPFVAVVTIDPDASMQFGEPSLAFDSTGRPQVLYARTLVTAALATCEDPECSSVSIREVFSAEGGTGRLRVGAPRRDGGPVFWVGGSDRYPEAMLVVCPDVECSEPTFHLQISQGAAPPAIATDSSGQTVVVSSQMYPSAVTVFRCVEPTCTVEATNWIAWEPPADLWIGPMPSAAMRNGLPVIAFQAEQGVLIGECAEADCLPPPDGSGIQLVADIPIEGMERGPLLTLGAGGEPIAMIEIATADPDATTWTGKIAVAACIDTACSDWVITELAEADDMYSEWSLATGPDGRVRIAWTEYDSVFLATCHNSTCSDFSIVDTGHPADDVGLAFDANGAPVIATMSRARGLELVFCGDDSCRIGG